MSRRFLKLFNSIRPNMKFAKSTLAMPKLSNSAKLGTLALSTSLFGFAYTRSFSQITHTESEFREIETISTSELQDGEMKEFEVGPTKDHVILISKLNGKYYASGGKCTHFGFNLSKGLLFDDKVICPLHHAAYSVVTGLPDEGPIYDSIPTYEIREENGKLFVKVPKNLEFRQTLPMATRSADDNRRFVILGAGSAALAAAETLRSSGYGGEIIMITNDSALPYDRTILTKNMFKVALPNISIRNQAHYDKYGITVLTGKNVKNVNVKDQTVNVEGLGDVQYDKLLVATGGQPRVPSIPGVDLKNVFTVRRFEDAERIRTAAKDAKNIVIIGGSFIGMETASNFKSELKDNANITVVEASPLPFTRALGQELGAFFRDWHEQNGVKLQLGKGIKAIEGEGAAKEVVLEDGTRIPADIVIIGAGVRPNSEPVANAVKLADDGSIDADIYLRTSNENVFAAGDVATYPSWYTGSKQRIEHYNEAIQQGQVAAYNMLGKQVPHQNIPFFWTRQYEKSLQYVGYGAKYDQVHIDGDLKNFSFVAYYGLNNRIVAAAAMGKLNVPMIISQAMQTGVLPTFEEVKSGQVSLEDIKKRIQQKPGASKCKREGCQKRKAQQQQ